MLIAAAILLAQAVTTIVYTDEEIFAMQWSPDGKQFYWLSEKGLNEWPSKTRWPLPKANFGIPSFGQMQMAFNRRGSKLLISGTGREGYLLFDPAVGSLLSVRGWSHFVWWVGDEIARVTPTRQNDEWTKPDMLELGGRKRELPLEWQFAAADQTVLLAKDSKRYEGPIALFRLDPKTLKVSRFRFNRGKYYTEYIAQDSLAWNERSQMAAIGITADTGATFASPMMSLKDRAHGFEPELSFLEGNPMWVGDRVLFSTREFREEPGKKINHGADIYRVRLYDPRTRKFQILESIDNHWIWRHHTEEKEYPPRSEQPTLGLAVATRDGKQVAYMKRNLGTSQIVVRNLH